MWAAADASSSLGAEAAPDSYLIRGAAVRFGSLRRGGVSERPKERASKAREVKASAGSNPAATATAPRHRRGFSRRRGAPPREGGPRAHRLGWMLRGLPTGSGMIDLDGVLFVGAVVLIVAIVAARIGSRVGLPSLLLFLALGMALGDSGPLGWRFDDADLAQALGFGALVLILAEGGLTTRWRDIRPSIGPAVMLATVGVGVSIGLMTVFGYFVLGLDLWVAVLLGAVTAPTDAAAVFSVLRRVPIPHRLRGMLEAESGLNDAPTVLIVGVASTAALTGTTEERRRLRAGRVDRGRAGGGSGDRDSARLARGPDPASDRAAVVGAVSAGHVGVGRLRLRGGGSCCTPAGSPPCTPAR